MWTSRAGAKAMGGVAGAGNGVSMLSVSEGAAACVMSPSSGVPGHPGQISLLSQSCNKHALIFSVIDGGKVSSSFVLNSPATALPILSAVLGVNCDCIDGAMDASTVSVVFSKGGNGPIYRPR